MSELIENARARRNVLKHLILQLHEGKAPEAVRAQLLELLGRVPYDEVVEVEQELISEGMPSEEIRKLCDLHSAAMKGALDKSASPTAPAGHPVHTFKMENEALLGELRQRGVPMHALSNYRPWYARIEARLSLSRFLEWSFVSCDTGVRKPDPRAYLGAARRLGVSPGECLFVDDRPENCTGAEAAGMPAILFEGAASLRQALTTRGIL